MRKDLFRLFRRVAILGVLGFGLFMVSNSPMTPVTLADDYCSYCQPFYNQCMSWCEGNYWNCIWSSPPGTDCVSPYESCTNGCYANQLFCQENCSGGGGGGGGGGTQKSPCELACYSARASCFGNHGIPDVEDCINEGGTYVVCCNSAFYDCMSNCE
ncbi:MAG TPA: hypothetical protein VIT19_08550 [Pyrinomonadaceae bacterium]